MSTVFFESFWISISINRYLECRFLGFVLASLEELILKKDLQNLLKAEKINDADQILLILPTAKVFPKIPVPAENSRPQKLWNLVHKVVALPYNVCTKPSQWRFCFVLR